MSCRHGDENLLGFVKRVNNHTFRVHFDGEDRPRSIQKKPGFYKVIAGGKKEVAKVTKVTKKPKTKPTNPQSPSAHVGRRSKAKPVTCGKGRCKQTCRDMFAGNGVSCGRCEHTIPYGDPVDMCTKCRWYQCVFCKTGEERPRTVAEQEVAEEDVPPPEVDPTADVIAGKTTGVPKKKAMVSPRETQAREEAYARQREKDRILAAKARGIPGIFNVDQVYPAVPRDSYPLVKEKFGYVVGGKAVPHMYPPMEEGNGVFLYQAVDFTAAHPSGLRKSFRRGMRIWATDDQYPDKYRPSNNDWSLIVLHVCVECHGGKLRGYPTIHAAPWAELNRVRNGVSRLVLDLEPQHIKQQELHICPLIEEDTHHCDFTNTTHTDFVDNLLERLKTANELADQEGPHIEVIGSFGEERKEEKEEEEAEEKKAEVKAAEEVASTKRKREHTMPNDVLGSLGEERKEEEEKEEEEAEVKAAAEEVASPKRKREHTMSSDTVGRKSEEELRAERLKKKPQLTYDASDTAAKKGESV